MGLFEGINLATVPQRASEPLERARCRVACRVSSHAFFLCPASSTLHGLWHNYYVQMEMAIPPCVSVGEGSITPTCMATPATDMPWLALAPIMLAGISPGPVLRGG